MKSVTLKEISKYKEGNTWYENEEFSGKVLVASPTFVSYSKPFMKVSKIYIILHNSVLFMKINIICMKFVNFNEIFYFHYLTSKKFECNIFFKINFKI